MTCIFVLLVTFGLYIDILTVSMGFTVFFSIYEQILRYVWTFFQYEEQKSGGNISNHYEQWILISEEYYITVQMPSKITY